MLGPHTWDELLPVVRIGKPVLTRNASALANALALVGRQAALAAAKATPHPAAAAPGKAIPVPVKSARGEAAEFVREVMPRAGVALTPEEAEQILGEVRNAPAEVKTLIDQLQTAAQLIR